MMLVIENSDTILYPNPYIWPDFSLRKFYDFLFNPDVLKFHDPESWGAVFILLTLLDICKVFSVYMAKHGGIFSNADNSPEDNLAAEFHAAGGRKELRVSEFNKWTLTEPSFSALPLTLSLSLPSVPECMSF